MGSLDPWAPHSARPHRLPFTRSRPTENLRAANPNLQFRSTSFFLLQPAFRLSRTASKIVNPVSSTTANMSSPSLNKIAANSASRQNPSELEQGIASALYDLETNTADLKAPLRPLQFVSAREVRIRS